MQQIIILDSETGTAHITECPADVDNSGSYEDELSRQALCDSLGIASDSQFIIALEINDHTK